jgi:hypothetical protein
MLESEVTDAERAAVAEVFELAGINVDIQAAYHIGRMRQQGTPA